MLGKRVDGRLSFQRYTNALGRDSAEIFGKIASDCKVNVNQFPLHGNRGYPAFLTAKTAEHAETKTEKRIDVVLGPGFHSVVLPILSHSLASSAVSAVRNPC
jgi:hypothetical protein